MARFFNIHGAPRYLAETTATTLYERKPVTELWNKLTRVAKLQWKRKNLTSEQPPLSRAQTCRIFQIHGPPGTGKSSAVFVWISRACWNADTMATWIHCSTTVGEAWTIGRDGEESCSRAIISPVPRCAHDLVDASSIAVFDGVRSATLETWRDLMNALARLGVFVIVVTCEVLSFHAGDSQDILKIEYSFPSWVMAEYEESCKSDELWRQISHVFTTNASAQDTEARRLELLHEKFAVAGHSARFMFQYTVREIVRKLSYEARTMEGIDSLERAVRAGRSIGSVNTVVARLDDDKNGATPLQTAVFPTDQDLTATAANRRELFASDNDFATESSYARLVSASATEKVIHEIITTCTDVFRLCSLARHLENQAMEGYAFKQYLHQKLREATQPGNSLTLQQKDNVQQLPVSRLIECSSPAQVTAVLKKVIIPDTWIFVAAGQQEGAFDAVHVVSTAPPTDARIRFVQVTVRQSHTVQWHLIDTLLRNLAKGDTPKTWSHLEFLILRPEQDDRTFGLDLAVGVVGLEDYRRFDGELWDRTDYRSNVQYQKLWFETTTQRCYPSTQSVEGLCQTKRKSYDRYQRLKNDETTEALAVVLL